MKSTLITLILLIGLTASAQFQPAYIQIVGTNVTIQPGPTNSSSGGGSGTNFLTAHILNVQDFGAVGDNTHDDTAAIQSAINACITNHPFGGTVYFPPAPVKYFITSQLTIPLATNIFQQVGTICLSGPVIPGQGLGDVNTGWTNICVSAIRTTQTVGSMVYVALNPVYQFNPITVDVENISFETPANPQIRGLNLTNAFSARIRGCMVWTCNAPAGISTAPSNPNAVGISTPANNNGAFTRIDDTSVCGFYTGYECNEHTEIEYSSAWKCVQAATFLLGVHASHFGRFLDVQCQHGLVWNGPHRLVVDEYDVERSQAGIGLWSQRLDDCLDSGNVGAANIVWATVQVPTGVSHTFNAIGTNILNHEVGKATWLQGNNVP